MDFLKYLDASDALSQGFVAFPFWERDMQESYKNWHVCETAMTQRDVHLIKFTKSGTMSFEWLVNTIAN